LGPTTDDLTSEAAAKAAGVKCEMDPEILQHIKDYFKQRQWPFSESNAKQALLPKGCIPLDNPVGTAPGFQIKIGRCQFFCVPGVPPEMKRMLSHLVLPRIVDMQGDTRQYCLIRNISTFGLGESKVGEAVAYVVKAVPGVKLGLRTWFPEIHVKLYAQGEDQSQMTKLLDTATDWVTEKMGDKVLSIEGQHMPQVVADFLLAQKATVALAESCTGGLIANWLTDIAGSSGYFLFSGVTYANEAKMDVLGVPQAILEQHGAVHEETAKAMAEGARQVAGSTYGLATSGIAGPDGGTDDKPVGTVCIGLATPTETIGRRLHFPFGKRLMNKTVFAVTALNMLRKELIKNQI
jgi:nicotinamide-nucleotide amidase